MLSYEQMDHGREIGPHSHMPIDVSAHWSITNPLNIVLALAALLLALSSLQALF